MKLTPFSDLRKQEIPLSNGTKLIVVDVLGKAVQFTKQEQNRNIFLLGPTNDILWRIAYHEGIRGQDPFVEVQIKENGVVGFTWDGWYFNIDIASGEIEKLGWAK